MIKVLYSVDEVSDMIKHGARLLLAGDETVLSQLPTGNWVAGTSPYFMGDNGGETSKEKIMVTQLPEYVTETSIKTYDRQSIASIYSDIPANGFGFLIIPAFTEIHMSFAINAPDFPGFTTKPLLGWVSGVLLDDLGKTTPKVINGKTGEKIEDRALMMAVTLPADKLADIRMLNIFKQGTGDSIVFTVDGFEVTQVIVDGKSMNFADYLVEKSIDTRLPLVADYSGAGINISIKSIDKEKKSVSFYAPVFKDVQYRFAQPVDQYFQEFMTQVLIDDYAEFSSSNTANQKTMLFSCNCILNYLYSNLEGMRTGDMVGPITFGEIAYQLLNQTLVYLTIHSI
ncbi:DUF6976 family protein [Leptolinea tardivitalis]|uniref:Uncharacterized protein n=1 Tax=Leptolinea tardivitalis TaxID=229920 RepID=A0A0P6XAN5_9CHLR|nr:hypothetical protein [Leptolinea tardivitalis]KPL71689.1 hypothetical protein ADM99_09485 [Leptolinea tardivitalis]GAP20033.1 hypothetical protein LTAR_00218 [Leptolinea tardivitalis]